MSASLLSRLVSRIGDRLDRKYGWDNLSVPLGLLTLAGLRQSLRGENLFDTNTPGHPPRAQHAPPPDLTPAFGQQAEDCESRPGIAA